jgi:hypothetical protein
MSVLALGLTLAACAPAYGQWGSWGNRSRYGSNNDRIERQAHDQGYNDGYRQGRDDARDGDRFDPRGQREYRSADNGRYRDSDVRRAYRQGFERGYERGFRDNRGSRNQRRR